MSGLQSTVIGTWRIAYNGDAFIMDVPDAAVPWPDGWEAQLVYEKPTAPANVISYIGPDPAIRNAAGTLVAPFTSPIPFP